MPAHTRSSSLGLVALCLAALLFGNAAAAQSLGRIERQRSLTMARQVREDLEKNFYDAGYKGVDLAARFQDAEQKIQVASTPLEVFGTIAQVLFDLEDSHTYFVPPGLTVRVDYGWEMQFVGDSCFVSEVATWSDARKQGVAPGDLVLSVNGNKPTRQNLWKLAYIYHLLRPQPGLRVLLQSPGAAPRQLDLMARVREHYRIVDLTGSDGGSDIWDLVRDAQDEAERNRAHYIESGKDLLVWKLPQFSGEAVAEGVKRLRDRAAVILDLRGNSGGSQVALLSLLGQFFSDDVAVGTLWQRSGKEPLRARGKGKGAFTGPLTVLVDSRSASASEVFARVVQLTGRGRVIGDRTAGAVMRSRSFSHVVGTETVIPYATSVTDADVVLPDGSRLEKTGVTPDVLLLPTSKDLAAERDPVLAHAARLAGVPMTPEQAWSLLRAK